MFSAGVSIIGGENISGSGKRNALTDIVFRLRVVVLRDGIFFSVAVLHCAERIFLRISGVGGVALKNGSS